MEEDNRVLARKLRGPKMRLAGFPSMDPLCHAFSSIAATRTRAELRPGIEVSVYGYEVTRHGDYLRRLPAPSAIYLLSFPQCQGAGLVRAHPRLLGKVHDIYLGGDGRFEGSEFPRTLTSIDLSIYGRFVELVASCFEEAVRELCGVFPLGPARRNRFEQLPGMVRIAPDASEIFVIKLNFHVADDRRGAGLDFVLPLATLENLKRDLVNAQHVEDSNRGIWAEHMLGAVLQMPLTLSGVIGLGKFEVGRLSRLKSGELIELPARALERVELHATTIEGPAAVAAGKLGALDGKKALRLSKEPARDFLAPLRRVVGER